MRNTYLKEGQNVAIRTDKGDVVIGVKDGQTYMYLKRARPTLASKTYTLTEAFEALEVSGVYAEPNQPKAVVIDEIEKHMVADSQSGFQKMMSDFKRSEKVED